MIKIIRKKNQEALPEKSIGTLLDRRWTLKIQKETLEAELREVAKEIEVVEDAIFLRFGKAGNLEGARGKLCQATIGVQEFVSTENWPATFEWIKKGRGTDRFCILQKRLSITTLREVYDDGKTVAGVVWGQKKKLNISKVK